ncbi:conserved hypothetical protein (plasmid) [Thioalkalivibrio sp. K90mix]|uniref:hypothetical protein n=1 Tax=Thioalkalivibrio sp. (strain K90mix) TaxID=396595 RepID=UPI000195A696|nr:hypothetical protein [Thioalkalivibrio sp. K90mix]ADC73273.1 conserved hypothetical protein [Thioalkalivibrio sp. K90mix]
MTISERILTGLERFAARLERMANALSGWSDRIGPTEEEMKRVDRELKIRAAQSRREHEAMQDYVMWGASPKMHNGHRKDAEREVDGR